MPRLITLTYGFGVGLAALAGVLAAPIYQVRPLMGADFIIVVFAVVVIGGMGSILGAIVAGFMLGVVEGLTKVFYPAGGQHRRLRHHGRGAAGKAGGLFGKKIMTRAISSSAPTAARPKPAEILRLRRCSRRCSRWRRSALYPFFLATALCFALFACAFNLLVGYAGLLSFGHALFFGAAAYVAAHAAQECGDGRRNSPSRGDRCRRRFWAWAPGRCRSAAKASISP